MTQCLNGHTVCSGCRGKIRHCPSCSQPVGSFIRNLLAERIVESLQVRCPYADHGCNQMMKFVDAERHMRSLCAYRPCPCPVPGCMHAGPKQILPQHLENEHQVEKTTKCMFTCYADFATWRFRLEASEQFAILEDHNKMPQLLLHREAIEGLGDILFCTCFEDHSITYNLKVMVVQDIYEDDYKPFTTIDGASAVDIRQRNDWKKDAILCCDTEKLTGKGALLQIHVPWGLSRG
jgi:hypothetical protein